MTLDPALLARARAAVLGRIDPACGAGGFDLADVPLSSHGPFAPPLINVRSENPPLPPVAPCWPSCEAVLAGHVLGTGAAKLFSVLHRLAVDVACVRSYAAVPNVVTFHVAAVMVAALVGYTDRHVRTLVGELERVGLLDAGGHAQAVNGRWMYSGTVWCVKTKPGELAARVTPDEWRRNWRPDFQADVESKRGAARLISELVTQQAEPEMIYRAVSRAAAGFFDFSTPLMSSSEQASDETPKTVCEVAHVLGSGGLLALPPGKRGHLVGVLASILARELDDAGWRRWYAGVILDALTAEQEARHGLAVLAAALHRIDADRREGAPWKRYGAVLAARLKAA